MSTVTAGDVTFDWNDWDNQVSEYMDYRNGAENNMDNLDAAVAAQQGADPVADPVVGADIDLRTLMSEQGINTNAVDADKGFFAKMAGMFEGKDGKVDPKLMQAGLLALAGGAQGLLGASAKDKEIKAYRDALETKNEQTIAAENRLAQRAAYGKVGKQTFAPKDTGLLAAVMKENK